MNKTLTRLWNDQEGQGLVEYAILLGAIALIAVAIATGLSGGISAKVNDVITTLGGDTEVIEPVIN